MTNKNSTYRRLGDYIREISVRNKDLSVSKLMGINIDKYFMPSVANVIGTDMSNYKVVANGQFACNLMHVGRDEKIPVALNTEDPIIVSPAYFVFEVCDDSLLPEYLELSLRNPEFDRNAWFHTDGDVRGGMDKEGMKDLLIPIPSIEEQRSIVSRYKAIETRIANNKQTIAKLEEAAQALYRKMFVDDVDVENLPDGWRMGCLGEVIKLGGGGTPSTANPEYWNSNDIAFYSPGDRTEEYFVLTTEKFISKLGLEKCSSKLYPLYTTFVTARGATTGRLAMAGNPMAMNQTCYAILSKNNNPFYIHQLSIEVMAKLKNAAVGAVFEALTTKDFDSVDIIIPNQEIIDSFESKVKNIYESILLSQKENEKLTEMLSLMA
ncbi:MAG: restriction endonuclease subunit S [Paludibacteraceae bacterium]|nr:restriction endonuclease subunit S [Paludibacteraceae bacterium]